MEKTVGKPIKRTEDPRLIQGLAHYVDDIRLPDTLHAAFLRSIYAHARIKSIDTTAAQKLPGVVAVYTGKDTAEDWPGAVRGGAAGLEGAGPSRAGDQQSLFCGASGGGGGGGNKICRARCR